MATGRFAPSPTGDLHLGNLRTALLGWLWSRHERASFIVRLDDLDLVTANDRHAASQLADLAALGLDWDGDVIRQSDHFDLYRDAITRLVSKGLTYPCYCTRREIADAAAAPNNPYPSDGYPGTCRDLDGRRRSEFEATGRPPALRLHSEANRVDFIDEVVGPVSGVVDDVVLRRNDGVPSYNLAVVVEDATQGIEIVVRGDDLLASTPRQIHLARLLGIDVPRYAHVPLVLAPDGRRLAKRDGAVTLADRRSLGDTPSEVVAFLAGSAGLDVVRPDGSPNQITSALASSFRPTDISREPLTLTADLLASSLR